MGRRIPDSALSGRGAPGSVFGALRTGRGVLFDLSAGRLGTADLAAWKDRVDVVAADPAAGLPAALLVRPDGHVAWASADPGPGDIHGLSAALHHWFGGPRPTGSFTSEAHRRTSQMPADATTNPVSAEPYPQPRACPLTHPESYMRLGDEGPLRKVLLYSGREVWLVTGHEAARQALGAEQLSAERHRPGYPLLTPRFEAAAARRTLLIGSDPPSHDIHRRLLNPDFSLRRIRAFRPVIEQVVDTCVDAVLNAGRPADLVQHFTLPVPSMAISHLLGVPYGDHEFFHDAMLRLMLAERPEQSQAAVVDLVGYLDRLITAMRDGTADDAEGEALLPRLVAEQAADDSISHEELVQLAFILLVAGHETTAGTLALGIVTLLEHPRQLAEALSGPEAMTAAVEEIVRFVTVTDHVGLRVAKADFELAGQLVRAGEGVIVSGTLANRDRAVFAEGDAFDAGRDDIRRHLAFGHGIHQCIGQNLARAELEIAFTRLFERIPTLRLAVPAEDLPLRPGGTVEGVTELPVTW